MTKEQLQRKFDELTVELKEMNSSDRSYQRVWDVIDPWHSDRSYQRVWDVIDPWHSECFLKSSDPLNPDYCECED